MIQGKGVKQRPPRLYKRPVSRRIVLKTLAELISHCRFKIYSDELDENYRLSWARVLTSALSSATASLKDEDLSELLRRVERLEEEVRKPR